MLYVELLVPWLNGVATYLLPAIGTSRVVNGMCLMVSFWPSECMDKVRPLPVSVVRIITCNYYSDLTGIGDRSLYEICEM